jgi:MFS family permease
MLALAALLMLLLIRESFDKKAAGQQEQQSIFKNFSNLLKLRGMGSLFTMTFILQFALFSSLPMIALFVQEITDHSERVVFYAGLVGAITGVANLIASPILGWLGDRVGHKYILIGSLIGAIVTLIPQAFIQHFWLFLILRFIFGIFIGGLLPSVNALIRFITPQGMESRAYGFNSSFLSLGNFFGPIIGGVFVAFIGIHEVFLLSAVLLLVNLIWLVHVIRRGIFINPIER